MAEDLFEKDQPIRRRYEVQQVFRKDDPILLDRDALERRMTQELIRRCAEDGVEIHPDTRLPGFILQPDPGMPETLKVCRIACEVAILPQLRWPRAR